MRPIGHAGRAKQHDPKEDRLEEERGQHFVGQKWPCDIADSFHEPRPVGAKLKRHGDARDDAHRKGQGEYLDPELIGLQPAVFAGLGVSGLEKQQDPAKCDGNCRKQDVERHIGRELDAGQNEGIHDDLRGMFLRP